MNCPQIREPPNYSTNFHQSQSKLTILWTLLLVTVATADEENARTFFQTKREILSGEFVYNLQIHWKTFANDVSEFCKEKKKIYSWCEAQIFLMYAKQRALRRIEKKKLWWTRIILNREETLLCEYDCGKISIWRIPTHTSALFMSSYDHKWRLISVRSYCDVNRR